MLVPVIVAENMEWFFSHNIVSKLHDLFAKRDSPILMYQLFIIILNQIAASGLCLLCVLLIGCYYDTLMQSMRFELIISLIRTFLPTIAKNTTSYYIVELSLLYLRSLFTDNVSSIISQFPEDTSMLLSYLLELLSNPSIHEPPPETVYSNTEGLTHPENFTLLNHVIWLFSTICFNGSHAAASSL